MTIRHTGHATRQIDGVDVSNGRCADVGDIALRTGTRVHGTTVTESGEAISGVAVVLRAAASSAIRTATSDAEGRFAFTERIASGRHEIQWAPLADDPILMLRAFGRNKKAIEVVADKAELRLELVIPGVERGR